MPVKVRRATQADVPAILAIEQQAPSAAHWTAEEYKRLLESGVFLLAEESGQACGFICAKEAAGEWEIENVAVAAEYRRRGIAAEMLRALVCEARRNSGLAIFLEVRESNLPAREFYAKHGFVEAGRRPGYYQQPEEDAVLYELRLK
jgi:ribosomal-protein-alanine acetyltransferase